jgi:O-Antigen ligase
MRPAWPSLLVVVSISAVAANQGGYFPTTWGWASVGFLWVAGLCGVLRSAIRISRSQALFFLAWAAVLGWTALSTTWSTDRSQTILEVERSLVYVSAAAMLILIGTRRAQRQLLIGLLCAIAVISLFSLGTRLFPNALRVYDPEAVNRLSQPIGYWNGLSAFTALGAVLALGFAAHGRTALARAVAAALLIPLLATFYFTFGRTGWIALAAGTLVSLGLDRRLLRALALLVALAPLLALDVWLSSQQSGLTHSHVALGRATRDGHHLAFLLAVLMVGAALVTFSFALLERHISVPQPVRVAFAISLVVACAIGAAVAFSRYGGPVSLTQRAWRDFKAPPSRATNLNHRLLSLSGNGRYGLWKLALHDAQRHPWLGSGAGSYERYFLRHQPANEGRVRDAHSLYLETLAELGPFGLALLVVALATPLVVAIKRGRRPLTAVAAGAYAVFLVHAATDWDWELPVVTLCALVCAAAVLLGERRVRRTARLAAVGRSATVVVAAGVSIFALVGLVGNSALSTSRSDLRAGKIASAEKQARRAASWAPWSPDPWDSLGHAQLAARNRRAARASFRKGLSIDRNDWRLWYDLARVTRGAEHRRAVAASLALFPRSGLRQASSGSTGP